MDNFEKELLKIVEKHSIENSESAVKAMISALKGHQQYMHLDLFSYGYHAKELDVTVKVNYYDDKEKALAASRESMIQTITNKYKDDGEKELPDFAQMSHAELQELYSSFYEKTLDMWAFNSTVARVGSPVHIQIDGVGLPD